MKRMTKTLEDSNMELIERNYSHSLQVYGNHYDEQEAQECIRQNLMRRLFSFISRDLQPDEVQERIIPKVRIRVVKILPTEGYNRPLFMGGLTVPQVNFEPTEEDPSPLLVNKFRRVGVEMPTDRMLSNKMERLYSDHTFNPDPFQVTSARVENVGSFRITEEQYSEFLETPRDENYSAMTSDDVHFETVKAVAIMALSKHLKEYPNAQRTRLESGINNLSKDIEDLSKREELKTYLFTFIDEPEKRPLMISVAEATLKQRSDSASKGIPLWSIITVVGVLLFGTLTYMNWDKITRANQMSKEVSASGDGGRIKNFMKALFTREGRQISKDYLNNKHINKRSKDYLDNVDFNIRQNKLDNERSAKAMVDLFKKFTNGRK